ncbi:hypothetical protein AB0I54_09320 [Streptomyces sp. NPDC050625]|uniref:hypothetical protein n=1 Tax=Streptomyces sp. NPDC050625 TaxID=3154629 RepID=UPI0034420304
MRTDVVTGVLTPEQETAVRTAPGSTDKADMYYKGEKIDPASDWKGANVCVEVSEDGTMRCFDSDAESNKYLAAHAPTAQARVTRTAPAPMCACGRTPTTSAGVCSG